MANLALCAQHLSSNLLWRIGDGWLVKIYGDPWVPHYLTFIVQSLPCLPKYSRVSALITATGHWNVSKVYCLFTFLEAELIMSIPLSYDTRDRRIWYFTRNAEYMVNSEYWAVWNLNFHPKCNTFYGVWPTMLFLPVKCSICGKFPKTIFIFIACAKLKLLSMPFTIVR